MDHQDDYGTGFAARLSRAPVKHALRVLLYEMRALGDFLERRSTERSYRRVSGAATNRILRPPCHKYVGYRGPWIEERFFDFWAREERAERPIYLPIFWTNFYLYAQTGVIRPVLYRRISQAIEALLDEIRNASETYYTLIEYDHPIWDWHKFPKNVVVFSAGGGGDIPIPLLGKPRPFAPKKKSIPCSFMGSIDGAGNYKGLRTEMQAKLDGFAHFGKGPDWEDIMARSAFTLSPRGLGPTSFRMYEALSFGSVPIYIWEDKLWLPYEDEIDWGEIGIVIERDEMDRIPALVDQASPDEIADKVERIKTLYDPYFTYDGVCTWVLQKAARLTSDAVSHITSRRVFG